METNREYKLIPKFGNSFGTGWNVMLDNFLRLFLVVIIIGVIAAPFKMLSFHVHPSDFFRGPMHWGENWEQFFRISTLGILAAFFSFIAILYAFLVAPVFRYGAKFIFVQTVRRIKPEFETLITGFRNNYLTIILANLLVFALVALGLFALLVPGIIIGCRLAFVSYIVMDKKIDPIEAVELSWKLTRGHGWTIFFMGFVSFFIMVFGFALILVGIFPAYIWIASSFAALYESVLREKEKPVEPVVE
jgi:hypothetical protein